MTSILIVEDHTIFAGVLLRMLRERGHMDVVAVAPSAEDALDQIPNLVIDLALVDVSLPHKSGIDLVLDLQQDYPDVLCVMLSGHASRHYAHSSLMAGARGYLLKDNTEEILDGIRRVLQGEIYVSEQVR
jgi:DNA-binding NarL/FixJ family response regulator